MRISIVAPRPEPYLPGGAERAWAGLEAALRAEGHDATIVAAPVPERTLAEVVRGYRTFAELDVSDADLVITSKYPAWMVSHPRHVVWMFHPLRGLYEGYEAMGLPLGVGEVAPATRAVLDLTARPTRRDLVPEVLDAVDHAVAVLGEDHPELAHPGPVGRAVVHWLDRVALDPARVSRHVALSRTVAARPEYFPRDVRVRVAHAPSSLPERRPAGPDGSRRHLFTASRLDDPKRVGMIIDAMQQVPDDVELLIAGEGPAGPGLVEQAGGDPRVRFLGRVEDADLADHYRRALAVPFVPYDEDYGLITLEAMAAGTPVVTTSDSGGPAELITSGVDGLIVAPRARDLGEALAGLAADPSRAAGLGAAGRERAARITWPGVVETLVGRAPLPPIVRRGREAPPRATTARRRKVVVLTTFRVGERGHGGQLRSYHLYGGLARDSEVEIVALTSGGEATSSRLGEGFSETVVPMSRAHGEAADELGLELGTPVTDLMAGQAVEQTPEYLARLTEAADRADLVVLAEPYLHPALAAADIDLPFVYDAFNVEAELKRSVIPRSAVGLRVLGRIEELERDVCRAAAVITACSEHDANTLADSVGRSRRDAVVVPNGTATAGVAPPDPAERARRQQRWLRRFAAESRVAIPATVMALFMGSWHPPNLAAAEEIVAVAPECRDTTFVLGGRHSDALAGRALPPNVALTGMVTMSAKDALLGIAGVALNPVRFGSGTNLKILEYLANGVPVVTTPFGARGIDVVDDEHLIVDDDLVRGLARVRDDPAATVDRALAGRVLVEERYEWSALAERFAAVVSDVLGGVRQPTRAAYSDEARI